MNRDNYISIDSALNQLLSQPVSAQGGSYSAFLEKLAAYDQQNLPLDIVLKDKLSTSAAVPDSMQKSIITLIWYRRLRTAAIITLFIVALGLGMNTLLNLINLEIPADRTISTHKSEPTLHLNTEITEKPDHTTLYAEKSMEAEKPLALASKPTTQAVSSKLIPDVKKENISIQFANSITYLKSISNLQSYTQLILLSDPSIRIEPEMIPSEDIQKRVLKPSQNETGFNPKSNYTIGFNVSSSYQIYHSALNNTGNQNINRNYEKLAQNGRYPGQVLNFGFTFEKPVYKALGISIGLQKITLEQNQKTNFILSEAPVYDLDGQIAGYIDISPEPIQETIENKLQYLAIPIQLTYNINLSRLYSVQVNSGSSLFGLMDQHIEKFNYTTLELDRYANDRGKISLNNLQFGLHCSRRLQGNFLLSVGYDYQLLNNIGPISDETERVNASLHSINLSLKFQR